MAERVTIADGSIDPGVARGTRDTTGDVFAQGSRVSVTALDKTAYLTMVINPAAQGQALHVHGSPFRMTEGDTAEGTVSPVGEREWRYRRLTASSNGRLTIVGLVVALAAATIKLAYAVPDAWALWEVSKDVETTWKWISDLGGLVGIVIVFLKGPWASGA